MKWEKWSLTQRLTYAAALFEARGSMQASVRTVDKRSYHQFRIRVRADDPVYMQLLVELFGGTVAKMAGPARVWHSYQIFGDAALDALKQLYPYLLVRGKDAKPFLDGKVVMKGRVDLKPSRARQGGTRGH